MIAAGIVISWLYSDEYIEIDLDELGRLTGIASTLEWWREEKVMVRYNTSSEIKRLAHGHIELTLHYEQSANPHINPSDSLWGVSTISFTPRMEMGKAAWQDNEDPANSGPGAWKRITNGLLKKKKREVVSRLQREQAKFRSAILAYDNRCALTGESSIDVLEAAHIIPLKDGGTEVIQNGLLLRADIHRLYDAGKFLIDPSGRVVSIKDISSHYFELLRNACISEETAQRIHSALLHQWDTAKSSNS